MMTEVGPGTVAGWLGLAGGLIGVVLKLASLVTRLGKMELKIDTLWDFQMRRGHHEALRKGIIVQKGVPPQDDGPAE